jgi:hypothetical protein
VSLNPILLIGGSGVVGRWTARHLREAHPDAPLLIGGRDRARAEEAAVEIGHAEGVVLDLAAADLGMGERPVSAVAVFFTDNLWRAGDDAKARFRAVDGTEMEATALSPYDVVGLATATGAPNVQFNLALGVSSTRRRGEPLSTEILIELAGEDPTGRPLRTRHAVVHPQGQMPLTGLGVAMVLERLTGLDGKPPLPAGLYFPYQLLAPTPYFDRLKQIGGEILKLDVL